MAVLCPKTSQACPHFPGTNNSDIHTTIMSEMLGGAVPLCTTTILLLRVLSKVVVRAMKGRSTNSTGLLFQLLFGFRQIRQDALLHFLSDVAAKKAAEEATQTVGSAAIDCDEPEARSARWIGHEYPNFEGSPEVVARIKHL